MENTTYIENTDDKNPNALNFKRVIGRILKHWYVVVIILFISLGIAFMVNRYSQRVYPSQISILIKESEEVSGSAELLYSNPLVDPYRNFYNEVYVIRSIPLLKKVVEDLNLMVTYQKKGQVKTSEVYKPFPFSTNLLSDSDGIPSKTYEFIIISNEELIIKRNETILCQCNFNDTLDFDGIRILFKKNEEVNLNEHFNEEYILSLRNSEFLASQYSDRLSIEWAEQGSSVVNISLTGEVPEKNVDFLNQLAVVYAEYDLEKKVQTASRSIDFISNLLDQIEDSLMIYESQLENFKAQNYSTVLDTRASALLTQLEELEQKKAEIAISREYFDYLGEYMNNPDQKLEQVVLPSMVGVTDPVIDNVLNQILEMQNLIMQVPDRIEDNNPRVRAAYEKLAELKRQINESIKNIEATQQITLNSLNNQINIIENQLTNLPGVQRRFITINRNYKFSEKQYDFLVQKQTEAGISRASSSSDILVVNPANSGGPIQPNERYNFVVAVVAGLGIPLLLFVLLEFFNRKVQSKEDIENYTNIPFIGSIGHAAMESNLLVHGKPKSAMAEAFRAIRSNLNYFTESKDKKVFLVSSSISGEGKTFTTINLATVFAYSGKKTLIIGADMRRPRIFGDFELTNNKGLSSYLSDQFSLDDSIQKTFVENLDLLSAGPVPPNPSELLLKKKFVEMFGILLEKYDYILIDSPPIALVTDALVIAKYVDHMVYVVRQNVTPREAINNIEELRKVNNISNISILFNDIKKTGLGYGYGKGYGYYYGYGYNSHNDYYQDQE